MDKSKIEFRIVELLGKLKNEFSDIVQDLYSYLFGFFFGYIQSGSEMIAQSFSLLNDQATLIRPVVHYNFTIEYLDQDRIISSAATATNWQEYLSPIYLKVSFHPELWTERAIDDCSNSWVIKPLKEIND